MGRALLGLSFSGVGFFSAGASGVFPGLSLLIKRGWRNGFCLFMRRMRKKKLETKKDDGKGKNKRKIPNENRRSWEVSESCAAREG